MVFLAPLALFCAALLALPVAVHLLVRRRSRQLDFPSLRYLRETPIFRLRPRRIQQPLLLALRLAALALLIIGFARPLIFFNRHSIRNTHIILLDASLSMNASGRTEAAKEQARNIIDQLGANDRAALIEFSSSATVLASLTFDRQTLLRALDQYRTKSSAADYAAGLNEAEALLQSEPPGAAEIDLISDFQRSGLNDQTPFFLSRAAANIITHPVGAQLERNAFLVDEAIESDARGSIEFNATEIVSANDGRSGTHRMWTIDAPLGARSNLEWRTESNNQLIGSLTTIAPDDFDADDKSFFAFTRPRARRVLLIDDATDADVYLRAALEAAIAMSPEKPLRDAFEERRELPAKAAELEAFSHLVLALHGAPRAEELNVINEYARRGGIVWLWLARDANANAWNAAAQTETGRALPFAQLTRIDNERHLNFVATDVAALPFQFMAERSIEALRGVRVRSAFSLTPRDDAATPLRWSDDGTPAFVTMKFGEGMVLLCATSTERAAGDLGQSAALPALTSAVLRMADALRAPLSQTIGEPVRLNLPPDTAIKITDAQGHITTTRARELASRAGMFFSEPGIYRIEWANGSTFLALNAPVTESERALAGTDEINRCFTNKEGAGEDAAQSGSTDLARDSMERQRNTWRYFLLAAFVLLIAELFIARKIQRTNSATFDELP